MAASNNAVVDHDIAAYLRITSIAIALYDYLETFPSAYRFYKFQFREQWNSRRLTLASVLFIMIRSISICALILTNVAFFYPKFTPESCRQFYMLLPSVKVLQAMVSQAILGIRAYNLSRRSPRIGCYLATLYLAACTLEWVTSIYRRTAVYDPAYGNCRCGSGVGMLGAWIYYAVAIVYDVATSAVCIVMLLQYTLASGSGVTSRITKMMLRDGLGYFVALTVVNVLNLILYRTSESVHQDIQTAGTSLGYAVTWIMSQRLLIHLHDASLARRGESINTAVTITQHIDSARDVSRALRSQFEKTGGSFELTIPDFDLNELETGPDFPERVDVEVRIERTVTLQQSTKSRYELEDYSRH